jgi:hypothetical protein
MLMPALAAWAAGVAALWPGLDPGLRGPVAAYSLLLAAMAFGVVRFGPRPWPRTTKAGRRRPEAPPPGPAGEALRAAP